MAVNELIQIIANFVDGVSAPAKKSAAAISQIERNIQAYNNVSAETGVKVKRVSQFFKDNSLVMKNNQEAINKLNGRVYTLGQVSDQVRKKSQKFQMQWLSVLFFGFALKRMFDGLIKTSLDWVGINQLMTTTLGVLFLPVAEQLLNILLPIFEFFMNLPKPMQEAIGWFVVFGVVLGGILMTWGQFALGLAGLDWLATEKGISSIGTAAEKAAGSSGVGGLLSKLASFAKYAGIAISFYLAATDITKGKLVAALGDIIAGVGIATGEPWVIGLGVLLKVIGDKDLQVSIDKLIYGLLDKLATVSQAISDLMKGNLNQFKADWGNLNIGASAQQALSELNAQGKFTSETFKNLGTKAEISQVSKQIDEIKVSSQNAAKTSSNFTQIIQNQQKSFEDLNKQYPNLKINSAGWVEGLNAETNAAINTANAYDKLSTAQKIVANSLQNMGAKSSTGVGAASHFSIGSAISTLFKNPLAGGVVGDAIIDPSGKVLTTSPRDYLIATTNPNGLSGSGQMNISPVYNVTVSDKSEFQQMLERNNRDLVNETRRLMKL